jgi:hypothetical protein
VQRSLGHLPVVGATSSSLDSPDPERVAGWNVYEIEDGVLARVYARVWDADRQAFTERAVPKG